MLNDSIGHVLGSVNLKSGPLFVIVDRSDAFFITSKLTFDGHYAGSSWLIDASVFRSLEACKSFISVVLCDPCFQKYSIMEVLF